MKSSTAEAPDSKMMMTLLLSPREHESSTPGYQFTYTLESNNQTQYRNSLKTGNERKLSTPQLFIQISLKLRRSVGDF